MAPRKRQIVAMGGGGFSVAGDYGALDDYVLTLARNRPGKGGKGERTPRICFLPTASGDSREYIVKFYEAFSVGGTAGAKTGAKRGGRGGRSRRGGRALRAEPSHLALFGVPPSRKDIR